MEAIRVLHTAIYLIMVSAITYILYAGATGQYSLTLVSISIALVSLESLVYMLNGWKCPLTTMALNSPGQPPKDYSSYFPNKLENITPVFFGTLFGIGLILLATRLVTGT